MRPADATGLVEEAVARRAKYAEYAYKPPTAHEAKATLITVDLRTGRRSIDRAPNLIGAPEKKVKAYAPPVQQTVKLIKRGRRPYAHMSAGLREEVRRDAADLLKVISGVSGLAVWVLTSTSAKRPAEVTAARMLFFACLQVSHPYISLHELARPIGCDHTIPVRSLGLFPERRLIEPISRWIEHPVLSRLRPKLLLLASSTQMKMGETP